jgi:hypothetical protein
MKKISMLLSVLFLTASVSAKAADFSVMSESGLFDHKMEKCFCNAWKHADPSNEQKVEAKKFMDATKAVCEQHKTDIVNSKKAVCTAWATHPVSKDSVLKAEDTLKGHLAPVLDSARDSAVGIINLLSQEQHDDFTKYMKKCMDDDDALFRVLLK